MTQPLEQPHLFDPPPVCPRCGATNPQDCHYDHDRQDPPGRRPKHCLNRTDPSTAPFPDGY